MDLTMIFRCMPNNFCIALNHQCMKTLKISTFDCDLCVQTADEYQPLTHVTFNFHFTCFIGLLASAHFVHDHFIYGKNVHVAK